MQDRELYARLLGLDAPWEVVGVDVKMQERSVQVMVAFRSDADAKCPKCDTSSPRHDTRTRSWRHLDTMQYRTVLTAEVPRVRCKTHGVRQVRVPWAEERSRFTALFECLVIDWLKQCSQSGVARLLDLSWDEVAGIMARAVRRGLARREAIQPDVIGVDETSFQRRHEYVTVVCDPRESKVLYVADGRSAGSLRGFFEGLSRAQVDNIQAVAMDMSGAYIAETRRALGANADERIVFDKFHIAKLLGDAVNKVRRAEHRVLLSEGDHRLKRTRHLWLANPEHLSADHRRRLAVLKATNLKVARAWAIKETTMDAFRFVQPKRAEEALRRALSWISRSRLEPMIRAGRTIRQHFAGVMNAIISGISNAASESINARIQMLKRRSAGFRNRARFRDAIYFHLGGLDLYPSTAFFHTKP